MGKNLVQAQPLVYTLQRLTGKRDNNIITNSKTGNRLEPVCYHNSATTATISICMFAQSSMLSTCIANSYNKCTFVTGCGSHEISS